MAEEGLSVLAVCVGNSNVRYGLYTGSRAIEADMSPAKDPFETARHIAEFSAKYDEGGRASVVVGSSNNGFADVLMPSLADELERVVFRIGRDVALPLSHTLDPEALTGEDRYLNAVGAYQIAQQACAVIDAGTAVTVDFVDGQGTFQGGAIAPGTRMSLDGLHRGTSALPQVEFAKPPPEVFGKNTADAMLNGVFYGIRGMVRLLVERYAEEYRAYPTVIATGGDAEMLFADDELIDRIVPDLTLRGIVRSCEAALDEDEGWPTGSGAHGAGG